MHPASKTIRAVYENGVFKPEAPVELPEHAKVEFEPRIVPRAGDDDDSTSTYEILSERYASGEHDVAERHNEHQP